MANTICRSTTRPISTTPTGDSLLRCRPASSKPPTAAWCGTTTRTPSSRPRAASVHPSLWRQSTLAAKQGLYEVVPGIYQVRGLDLSNISFIEGDTGLIVIDPLVSTETAAAALQLYRTHRGRPARRRGDLHPQPRRPLRWRAGRHLTGGRRRRQGGGPGAGRFHRARRAGERLRRSGHDASGHLYVRQPAGPRPAGQVGCGLGQAAVQRRGCPDRPAAAVPATGETAPSTAWRSSSRWHRAPKPRPKCISISRDSAHCVWPRTRRITCTTC